MCHLLLLLPLLILPALWLLPPGAAFSVVAIITMLGAVIFWLMLKAMRAPVITGVQGLMHAIGVVRRIESGSLYVWLQSELWPAESDDASIEVGDAVEVFATKGLTLQVRKAPPAHGAASGGVTT